MSEFTGLSRVYNLLTEDEKYYTLGPRDSVLAAYAQGQGDYNTWDYEEKYGHLVIEGEYCWFCGNYGAMKDDPKPYFHMAPEGEAVKPEGWNDNESL